MSDPVDTSMYNKTPPNMMGSLGPLMGIMQGVRQQQLFQAQMMGKAHAGQAFLDAGDPSDPNFFEHFKGNLDATGDPYAIAMAPEVSTQARQAQQFQQQFKLLQAQTGGADLDAAQKGLAYMSTVMAPLMAKPDLSRDDIIKAVVGEVGNPDSPLPHGMRSTMLEHLISGPNSLPTTDDSSALHTWVQLHSQQNADAQKAVAPFLSQPEMVDAGHSMIPIEKNPNLPNYLHQAGPAVAKTQVPEVPAEPPSSEQWSKEQSTEFGKVSDWVGDIANRQAGMQRTLTNLEYAQKSAEDAVKGGLIGPHSKFYGDVKGGLMALAPDRLKELFGVESPDAVLSTITADDPKTAQDVFNKLNWDRGLNQITQSMQGTTGHMTEKEVMGAIANTGNVDMTPGAIQDLFNYIRKTGGILSNQQEFAQHFFSVAKQDPLKYNIGKAMGDWDSIAKAKGYINYAPWAMMGGQGEHQ